MKMNLRSFTIVLAAASLSSAAEAPRPAPEFVINTVSGEQLRLSQYRGKVIALEFLLTSCIQCQTSTQLMNRLYNEYGSRGFQPIGVAFNDLALLELPGFITRNQVAHPIGAATPDAVYAFLRIPTAVRYVRVPLLAFVDRRGAIRSRYAGDEPFFLDEEKNMRTTIEGLLREPAPPGASDATARSRKTGAQAADQ